MNKYLVVILVTLVFLAGQSFGATDAYWQLDEDADATSLVDAVGTYDLGNLEDTLTKACSAIGDLSANPDPGPFSTGTPADNPSALNQVCGLVQPGDANVFGMNDRSWTVELYLTKVGSASEAIVATRHKDEGSIGWEMVAQGSGRIDVRMSDGVTPDVWLNTGTTVIPDSNWHHVALSWDHDYVDATWGAVGQVTIWIDHAIAAQGLGDAQTGENGDLIVGGRDDDDDSQIKATNLFWVGDMDEIRWSDTVITSSAGFLPLPDPSVRASGMDFNCDEIVDFKDFAEFAADWRLTSP